MNLVSNFNRRSYRPPAIGGARRAYLHSLFLCGMLLAVLMSAGGHVRGSATALDARTATSAELSGHSTVRSPSRTSVRVTASQQNPSALSNRSGSVGLPAALSIALATPTPLATPASAKVTKSQGTAANARAASVAEQAPLAVESQPVALIASPTPGAAPSGNTVLYIKHTIAGGETLTSIAREYGVSVATIMVNNPQFGDFDSIKPGQTLQIPNGVNGTLYDVRAGDTLQGISRRFGVDSSKIIAANNLESADAISSGQRIVVPQDVQPPVKQPVVLSRPLVVPNKPPAAPAARPATAAAPAAPAAPRPAAAAAAQPAPVAPPPAPPAPTAVTVVRRFIWPVQGPITQGFGVPELGVGAPHTGIDIAVPLGTPVHAAGPGTVVFAGGDACCSYGYYVIISHPGGLTSLYGHLSRIGVSVGQSVGQGDVIGSSGSTGFSTGPHVHFEVHLNGTLVNPFTYLP